MFEFLKRKPTAPQQSVIQNSGDALVAAAINRGLIPPNRDLGVIPELVPMFERASRYFVDLVINGMADAARRRDPDSGLALMQRSCMYLFGKSAQAVMLWGLSSNGKIDLGFEPGEMVRMELGAESALSPEGNKRAADAMANGLVLFAAHRAFMEQAMRNMPVNEEFVRREMHHTLQWVPRIGISWALMNGFSQLR